MVGRGTRLRSDLFGPGKDKQNFKIFDVCGNLEFFSQPVPPAEGASSLGLSERLFGLRVELISELDEATARETNDANAALRPATATLLREQVAAMPIDNFLVRTKRRLAEKYSEASAWKKIGIVEQGELIREVAALPSGMADSDLDAKQFDLLMLGLQLSVLRVEPRFDALKKSVIAIASALEEKQAIPMVRDQMLLIQDLQTTQFWESVTLSELEHVRLRLRALIKFLERTRREPIYTDFQDEMHEANLIRLPEASVGVDTARFREKALTFLRDKMDEPALHKIRWNEPLTPSDLESLEEMLVQAGIGTPEEVREVSEKENGLGLFLRSLVGLDRAAAKRAFDTFINERQLNGNQLDFINLVIEHLTQSGWMRPEQLYSSPFTDEFSGGPNAVFSEQQSLQDLISTLAAVERNASGTPATE